MDIQDVLREMRWCQQWPAAQGWADAIEAAMTQPVAEVVHQNGLPYGGIRMTKAFSPGTKFYALPPAAAAEIQPDWDKLEACQQSLREHMAEIERLREVLEIIERWKDFPESDHTWGDGTPMSYGAAFGSIGERDYMRGIARTALTRKEDA